MSDLKVHDAVEAVPLAHAYIEQKGGEWQVMFSVGVQHFDIGPRYELLDEASWMQSQFAHALDEFIKINKEQK